MTATTFPTPAELLEHVRSAKAGDRAALAEVVEALAPFVRRKAREIGPPAAVEDLRQTGALAVLQAVRGFDLARGVPFFAYACAAVVHNMLQARQRDRRRAGPLDFEPADRRRQPDPDAFELPRLLGRARPGDRRALALSFGLDGTERTQAQVAALMGTSRQRTHQRIRRGLSEIRQSFARNLEE